MFTFPWLTFLGLFTFLYAKGAYLFMFHPLSLICCQIPMPAVSAHLNILYFHDISVKTKSILINSMQRATALPRFFFLKEILFSKNNHFYNQKEYAQRRAALAVSGNVPMKIIAAGLSVEPVRPRQRDRSRWKWH